MALRERTAGSEADLRLFRYFVAVAEAGSFTEAAEALHVSQPALSQAVRRLEDQVGTRLIDRGTTGSRRGVRLTHAGDVLLPAAQDAVATAARALTLAREAVEPALLRVGFGTSTPRRLTRAALRAAERLPTVRLELEYVPWGSELAALQAGQVDLVFLHGRPGFARPGVEPTLLATVHRMAVFHVQHALAGRPSVSMGDLADEPIIDAASDRDYWIVDPRPDDSRPRTVGPPARTVEEMLAFVSDGRGMAITTSTVAATNGSHELAFVPISDLDPAVVYLATRATDRRPEVTAARSMTIKMALIAPPGPEEASGRPVEH